MRYILNPDKTEDLLYTASVNCMTDAESAYLQMRLVYNQFAKDHFNSPPPLQGKGSVKAIHYIQSFSPDDDVTPELAHKIAKAFLRKAFGDDVQAVIATHVDKDHLHSHIIINSYSLSGQKYYANRQSLKRIREMSDGVCKAFGIEIHPNLTGKGRSINHKEWEHKKNGPSWKQQIRDEIDKLIHTVNSLDKLLQSLEEHGYEVKRGKYISIRAPGQERFVRTKTLGDEYTEDSLNIRIRYREVVAGNTPEQSEISKLQAAYVAIIGDVRILAAQRKKVPRKRIVTAEYSVENDLDVYKLSAQLSVISKDNIKSIGDLQGRIAKLRADYEKQRVAVNDLIDEYNNSLADGKKAESLYKRIAAQKEKLLQIRQRYDVYCDIAKTYGEISKGDYISNLVEEERKRQEQAKKKLKRR
ncbi:relaxase/mobilization nuclease domain-containing protein [Ruminococcus sp.]|uniref:relaxase/mobilization nuclease domain-containing protein n=1 Tax=Ruminococcus sp. TaxID=41978 RepID=UPI0025E15B53|nr:relaxase/mobilization nuclease domain-containing protein [Ruminococcus sp.]